MLDLPRMQRIQLTARPRFQRFLAYTLLTPNYRAFPGVKIHLEGLSHLPREPVIYAMNHTDRYNYWPFQYQLWREVDRFTATWVKGKYYQSSAMAWFMEVTNNIPTVSRGYLITRDFLTTVGRRPSDEEYAALRDAVEAAAQGRPSDGPLATLEGDARRVLEAARDMLGRRFEPAQEPYGVCMDRLFRAMMREFVALNERAFDAGLDVLVFPQGTRSKRLSRGHIGLAQIALHFRRTVVPVGCNGSDHVYPGGSPVAKAGRVVYRFGEPVSYESAAAHHVPDFEPFTPEAEAAHRDRFEAYVDDVMHRIDGLLDEPYRFSEDRGSEGVAGSSRFV